jgi:hypothetical protein
VSGSSLSFNNSSGEAKVRTLNPSTSSKKLDGVSHRGGIVKYQEKVLCAFVHYCHFPSKIKAAQANKNAETRRDRVDLTQIRQQRLMRAVADTYRFAIGKVCRLHLSRSLARWILTAQVTDPEIIGNELIRLSDGLRLEDFHRVQHLGSQVIEGAIPK